MQGLLLCYFWILTLRPLVIYEGLIIYIWEFRYAWLNILFWKCFIHWVRLSIKCILHIHLYFQKMKRSLYLISTMKLNDSLLSATCNSSAMSIPIDEMITSCWEVITHLINIFEFSLQETLNILALPMETVKLLKEDERPVKHVGSRNVCEWACSEKVRKKWPSSLCLHKKFRTIYSQAILEQGTHMYLLTRRRLLKFSCNEIVKFFLKMHINLQLRDKAQKASRSL